MMFSTAHIHNNTDQDGERHNSTTPRSRVRDTVNWNKIPNRQKPTSIGPFWFDVAEAPAFGVRINLVGPEPPT